MLRPTPRCRWFLAACICALLAVALIDAAQTATLLPVDQAASRPEFFSFRSRLQAALARHDVEQVMAVVHRNIKNSFGGDDGVEGFRRIWKPTEPDSRLWSELATVLALGGTFGDNQRTFVAPYTFSRWPDGYDGFEHVVLVASDVRIRDAPRVDAPVVTSLSFAILPLARVGRDNPRGEEWTAVRVGATKVGYVASQFARSPIDYRAMFSLQDGRWQLMLFLAGD